MAGWDRDKLHRLVAGVVEAGGGGRPPEFVILRDGWEYCSLCGKYSDPWHLSTEAHFKREFRWQIRQRRMMRPAGFALQAGTLPAGWGDPAFYTWMYEWDCFYCKLCRKEADDEHVQSRDHRRRAMNPGQFLQGDASTGTAAASAPRQPDDPPTSPPPPSPGQFLQGDASTGTAAASAPRQPDDPPTSPPPPSPGRASLEQQRSSPVTAPPRASWGWTQPALHAIFPPPPPPPAAAKPPPFPGVGVRVFPTHAPIHALMPAASTEVGASLPPAQSQPHSPLVPDAQWQFCLAPRSGGYFRHIETGEVKRSLGHGDACLAYF